MSVAFLLFVAMAACDQSASVPLSTATLGPEPSVTSSSTTTTTEPGFPNCTASAVSELVQGFVSAYNSGVPDVADRFFADEPAFEWYAERPTRLHGDSMDRSTLATYLRSRHSAGHRFELTGYAFTGYRAVDDTGHFTFARVGPEAAMLSGKGAVDCVSGLIIVWAF